MDRVGLRKVGPVILLYLFLAAGSAATRLPQSDEGWFGIPAWHLAFEGRLVNPVVVPVQAYHQGIDRKTYIAPPLHFLELAASFRVAGFGLFQARGVSVFWGLVAVLATAQLLWALTGSFQAGALAAGLVAVDFALLSAAASSRSDLPCLGAGLAGLALYFSWRGRSLGWGAFLGNALAAVGCFIHPNGLAAFVFLQGATIVMDRTRLTKRDLLLASLPYALGGLAWGLYVSQELALFRAQLGSTLTQATIDARDNTVDWIRVAGLGSGPLHLNAVRLAPFLALGLLLLGAVASSSNRPTPGLRVLLAYAAWNLAFLAFITPSKGDYYLLFATVPALLVAAAFLASPAERLRLRSPLWAALGAVLVVGNLTRTASRIATDAYHREWLPVVDFVIASSAPTESVIASREFFFGFGGRRPMIDDYYYGSRTGRLARWVVLERDVAPGDQEPDSDRFRPVAARYDRVFTTRLYEVCRLR